MKSIKQDDTPGFSKRYHSRYTDDLVTQVARSRYYRTVAPPPHRLLSISRIDGRAVPLFAPLYRFTRYASVVCARLFAFAQCPPGFYVKNQYLVIILKVFHPILILTKTVLDSRVSNFNIIIIPIFFKYIIRSLCF